MSEKVQIQHYGNTIGFDNCVIKINNPNDSILTGQALLEDAWIPVKFGDWLNGDRGWIAELGTFAK